MHHLIDHVQHSFIPGKSCVTQLVPVLDYFGSQLVVSLLVRHRMLPAMLMMSSYLEGLPPSKIVLHCNQT